MVCLRKEFQGLNQTEPAVFLSTILETNSAKAAIKVVLWKALYYTTQKGNGLWRAIGVFTEFWQRADLSVHVANESEV